MKTQKNDNLTERIITSLDSAGVFVALIDNHADVQWMNKKYADRMGNKQESPGLQFHELLDPALKDLAQDILIAVINDGVFRGELLLASYGESIPAYVTASYISGTKSDDFSIIIIAIDRTDQKLREDEARKRRDFLNSIIKRAPVGIFCLDNAGFLTIINDSMAHFCKRAGIQIKSGENINKFTASLSDPIVKCIFDGLDGKQTDCGDVSFLKSASKKPVVNVMCSPILSPDGIREGVAVLIEDRTEKVRLMEKMQQADRLSSAGILAAGVAHEVNNPLMGITGILGNIRKEAAEKNIGMEPFDRIQNNLDRIRDIVNGLMDFSRRKIGIITEFSINDLVSSTVSFFALQPGFKWQEFRLNLEKNIPQASGDAGNLEQVFQNIILNAAQANGDEGIIEISTGFDKQANEVVIRITDSGPGIPPDVIDKIFEPFFTTKEPGKGTGLGLAVCNSLIQQHGGTIAVEKTSEKGTTFAIRLPVKTH